MFKSNAHRRACFAGLGSRFSRHIKYPIKEKISVKLADPETLNVEYDGQKKIITDPEEIDYVRRTIGPFAAKKLEEGTRLNEHDIYGDGRRAMDLMFVGKAKFSDGGEISRINQELERSHKYGGISSEEYGSMRRLLDVLRKEEK